MPREGFPRGRPARTPRQGVHLRIRWESGRRAGSGAARTQERRPAVPTYRPWSGAERGALRKGRRESPAPPRAAPFRSLRGRKATKELGLAAGWELSVSPRSSRVVKNAPWVLRRPPGCCFWFASRFLCHFTAASLLAVLSAG